MIDAICGIKTSVCTGNCNSCVNSPLLGKTAIEEKEYSKSAYNKGYANGKKDAIIDFAQTVIKCLGDEPILQMAVKRVAFSKFGVEVEE